MWFYFPVDHFHSENFPGVVLTNKPVAICFLVDLAFKFGNDSAWGEAYSATTYAVEDFYCSNWRQHNLRRSTL